MILPVAAALAATGTAAYGAFYRNSPVFGSVLHQLPTAAHDVSLTFDDGPNPYATPLILDALERANVKVTFFFLGRHVERWPDIARRAAAEGHQIGNHGYFHRKLHFRGISYVRDDIGRGRTKFRESAACGESIRGCQSDDLQPQRDARCRAIARHVDRERRTSPLRLPARARRGSAASHRDLARHRRSAIRHERPWAAGAGRIQRRDCFYRMPRTRPSPSRQARPLRGGSCRR